MMKQCEQYKELILTDYLDGELSLTMKQAVEEHLLDCGHCRVFFAEVKNNAVGPLHQARLEPVPEGLWQAVRDNIEKEKMVKNPFEGFVAGVKGLFVLPRLVPIFASLIVMLLAGSAALNNIQIQQAKSSEQGEYLVSLLNSGDALPGTENNGLGTSIEHYFL